MIRFVLEHIHQYICLYCGDRGREILLNLTSQIISREDQVKGDLLQGFQNTATAKVTM